MATILTAPIFKEIILPFVLIFVVVFAILQKTQVLGKGKRQIDSITALMIALITVSFAYPTGIIGKIVPFLAVAAVIILILMVMLGFVGADGEKAYKLPDWVRITIEVLGVIGLAIAVLWATGAWSYLLDKITNGVGDGGLITNIFFIIVIIGVVVIALTSGKNGEGKGKGKGKEGDGS